MALKWKSKIILLKMETDYRVDPTPAGGNGMLMTDVQLRPMEGQDVSRDLETPYRGAQEVMPVGIYCVLTGKIELVPSGTAGVVPAWGPAMRTLGCAEVIVEDTSVAYHPITDSNESSYIKFWIGGSGTGNGNLHKIEGVRGDGVMRWPAQGLPYLEVTFTGLYGGVAEAARIAPTLTGFKRPRVVSQANTPVFSIDDVDMVMRTFALAMRNDVQPRLLVGSEEVLIVDSADQITTQVEMLPLSDFNPFDLALADEAASLVPVAIQHGTADGFITALSAPHCQLQRPSGFQNNQGIAEQVHVLNALPSSAGNDQWTLTLT